MTETLEVDNSSEEYVTSLKEASRRTGVQEQTIRHWILTGKLPAEKILGPTGWAWKMKAADLDAQNEKSLAYAGGRLRGRRGRFVRDEVPEDA